MILLKKKDRTQKLQSGGSVPVYKSYDVQMRPESATADIGVMMAKHTPKSDASANRATKPKDPIYKDIKGLPVDVDAYFNKSKELEEDMAFMMRNNPQGYINDPNYIAKTNEMNVLHTKESNRLSQEYDNHKAAGETIRQKGGSGYGSQWIMQDGKGYVVNTRTKNTEIIDPGKILDTYEDSNGNTYRKYKELTYQKGWDRRATSKEPIINTLTNKKGSMVVANDFTNILASGMSEADVYKHIIEPIYEDVEYNSGENTVTVGNVSIGLDDLKKQTQGSSWSNNTVQLDHAYKEVFKRVQNSAAFDTLMASAYRKGAKNYEEATKLVNQEINNNMLKHLKISTGSVGERIFDEPKEEEAKGGTDGPLKRHADALNPLLGKTAAVRVTIDRDATGAGLFNVDGKKAKSGEADVTTSIVGYVEDHLKDTRYIDKVISDQPSEWQKKLRITDGFLEDGSKIKDITSEAIEDLSASGEYYDFNSVAIIDKDADILAMELPVDKNTGAVVDLHSNKIYQNMIKELEKSGIAKDLSSSDLSIKGKYKTNLMKIREDIINKALDKLALTVELKKVAAVKVIYPKESIKYKGIKQKEGFSLHKMSDEVKTQNSVDRLQMAMTQYAPDGKTIIKAGEDIIDNEMDDFATTYVYYPYTDAHLSIIDSDKDADAWTPAQNLEASNLAGSPKVGGAVRSADRNILKTFLKNDLLKTFQVK